MTCSCPSFALSPLQRGMLFHHLTEQHSGVDIEQVVLHLPEKLDVGRLEAAWQWLIERHDILRARFIWEGVEEPCQQVMDEVRVPFAYEDARSLTKAEQDERLKSFLEADREGGFDLNCAPMLRLTVFQWQEASFSVVWTFHHALLDGRSYPILLREAFEAYAELLSAPFSRVRIPFRIAAILNGSSNRISRRLTHSGRATWPDLQRRPLWLSTGSRR